MAPKKKQQLQQKSKVKSQSSDAKNAPKLQISAENERRLRRLLLNTERPAASSIPTAGSDETMSRNQKAKKLRNVYDKLSLEGFSSEQIEKALSALGEGVMFESALDWLCFNLPGDELPLKFSSGVSAAREGPERAVKVISTARHDWVPSHHPPDETEEVALGISIRIKGKQEELSLDLGKPSQADWIRQYMRQQEEQEDQEEEEELGGEASASFHESSIIREYHLARVGALEAKQTGDKKNQERLTDIIRKLRQEMSLLGLSDEIVESGLQDECTSSIISEESCHSITCKPLESKTTCDTSCLLDISEFTREEPIADENLEECCRVGELESTIAYSEVLVTGKVSDEKDEPPDLELDDLFSEDSSSSGILPPEILKLQKRERFPQLAHSHTLGNIDEIWRKGDPGKIPKAVLQKTCQRLCWEAPKYSKLMAKDGKFLYSVSVLRTASGRGKNRKAGGLVTLQLPDKDQSFTSAEDAQNRVATYALCQLFPDLPLDKLLVKPYSSLVLKWEEEEHPVELENREEIRRAGFVDSLLSADNIGSTDYGNVRQDSVNKELLDQCYLEKAPLPEDTTRIRYDKQIESNFLKQELENKIKIPKYMEMLKTRAALPIVELKKDILQLLKVNDVLVVCGETGCGKTTQVPQYILDDMIESGQGGHCNIICTQPRRIAAISVAERVSDERCESSPGSDGSLVGFQVRLDSARSKRTKLLFCTTGILLRKLAGDKVLADVTHVIVDEVHERSLLGDFLLVVLKNLIERRPSNGRPKLKVVLMSATVDPSLFSRYFENCPVITAKGRTYPVTTCFLEDLYEKLNYCLPSDSPASGTFNTSTRVKLGGSSLDNRRGKKNLVLSSWGDESLLFEDYLNPCYDASLYDSYSEQTRQNLKKLNEDVVDYDFLEDLICHIDENYPAGAILVFLPGVAEIYTLVDKLIASYRFGGSSSDWILPLHSSLASAEQRKVFLSPPQDTRKVIVATDIAETSITIDDVTYVIDTGKHKENRYNPQKKMSSMVEDWISRANARQRRGRAGRVKPGICFCLYTHHRFESLMRPFQVPEILRMPLTELCLQIKSLSLGDIKSFLLKAIEPPREEAISSAIAILYEVGAVEGGEKLTPLGHHLAKLPVDVLIGKMMLYGAIFGCLSPILSIAAFLSYKFPFVYLKDEKQNVERAKLMLLADQLDGGTSTSEGNRQSDHLLLVVAYNKWARVLREKGVKAAQQFCRSYFLSTSVMYMIRDMRLQFGNLLADIGLISPPTIFLGDRKKDKLDNWLEDTSQPFNMYSHHSPVVKSIVCAGLYPNIAAREEGIVGSALGSSRTSSGSVATRDHSFWFDGRREVHIHPSSVNYNVKHFRYPFLVFLEKVETSKVFLRDTTITSPYSILLFGGSIKIQHQTGLVIIDDWLKLTAPAQTAVLFKELRLTLHAVMRQLIQKPEVATVVNNEVVRSIVHLLLEEDKQWFQ